MLEISPQYRLTLKVTLVQESISLILMTMLCFDSAKRHVKFFMPCCNFKKPKVTFESRLEKQFFMTSLVI